MSLLLLHILAVVNTVQLQSDGSTRTLASGKESLKNVGSHDRRVKKVLAVQRCVTITALLCVREGREGV